MFDQRVYLRVKIKSLAAEAHIIRREEGRSKHMREGLANHRRTVVRDEQRHTLLAYGFLRGLTYSQLEQNPTKAPDWKRVQKMVEKYGVIGTLADRDDQTARFRQFQEGNVGLEAAII